MSVVTYTTFDGELVEENRDGTILDYVPDSLGSIIMWVEETGLPAGYTPYWPYGEPWQEPEVECPFQFVGKYGYYRDLSGTYVRARVYEPEIGRWMTVDPLWPREAAFEYVLANPTTLIDPSGLQLGSIFSCVAQMLRAKALACQAWSTPEGERCVLKCIRDNWPGLGVTPRERCLKSVLCRTGSITIIPNGEKGCRPCIYPCGATVAGQGSTCNIGICQAACEKTGDCAGFNKRTIIHEALHCCETASEVWQDTEPYAWATALCIIKNCLRGK